MNRKSLFGRLANSTTVAKKAERQEYFRVNLEPLEDRKMLAVYYNDDWTDENGGDLEFGDIVSHPSDFGATVTMAGSNLTYGFDAFGKGGPNPAFPDIKDAIDAAADDEQVLIAEGTHFQSDIVIDHPLLLEGQGQTVTFIYPETTSAATTGDFPSGTHSGIIIHSDGVVVSGLTLDGNGNTALSGSLNYHHGITTLYDTPGGSTVHNGTLATMVHGPATVGFPDETSPDLLVQNVTVKNAFWHGITISPLEDKTFDVGDDDALQLGVYDSTVDNIGPATKTLDHIGVLMQNIHDSNDDRVGSLGSGAQAAADGLDFGTNGMLIKNVGVGVKTAPFGSLAGEYGSRASAHNSTETLGVLVDNAAFYAYWIIDSDDSNQDLLHASLTGGSVADSVGIFLDHSRGDLAGNTLIDGYDIGLRARNVNSNFTGGAIFIGPGSATSGSVGIQLDNDSGDRFSGNYESSFLLSALTQVSGFETGVLSEQDVIHADPNTLILDRATISGNATQVSIGNNSVLTGQVDTDDIEITGTGSFRPRMDSDGELFDGSTKPTDGSAANPTPGSLLTTKATTVAAANLTLGSGSTFSTLITGEDATNDIRWDFDTKVGSTGQFPQVFIPPFNYTQSLVAPQTPIGAVLGWGNLLGSGTVIQDGTGELVVDDQTVGDLFNSLYYNDHSVVNGSVYVLSPEDHSDRTYINLSLKLGSDNESPLLFFGLTDWRANTRLYTIPTHILNTTTYTTVTLSVNSGTVDIDELTHTENYGSGDQDDLGLDASNISGYVLAGDNGLVYGDTTTLIEFSIADITFSDQKNSTLEVSGAIDLGGAALTGNIRAGFSPAGSETFTIINNTHASDLVSGTFAGLAEGATFSMDGENFTISYTGGTGNDVVLTSTGAGPTVNVDNDPSANEGDAGTTDRVFTVSLSNASASSVTVPYTTTDGTALVSNSDYAATSGTLTFAPSETTKLVTVAVTGDTDVETDEAFTLDLGSPVNAVLGDGSGTGTILNDDTAAPAATVTARRLFYNDSAYDPSAAAEAGDISAEDTSKSAYLPGGGAWATANSSNYDKGINGIIVEVTGTHGTLTPADFTVRMSGQGVLANNAASSWAAAPTPSVTVFSDSPVAGTDRVHLIWANGAITNRYLEVVVEGNDTAGGSNTNTGLASSDIFFYANMIAETDFAGFFNVDATDEINARNNQGLAFTPVNTYDFNKDFVVDASDQIIARNNGDVMFALTFSNPPAAPAPPAGDDDGAGSAIASALAATGSSEGGDSDSGWVSESLASSSAGGGSASSVFAQMAEADSPGELTSSDGGDDELDSLLDSLLDDLGLE